MWDLAPYDLRFIWVNVDILRVVVKLSTSRRLCYTFLFDSTCFLFDGRYGFLLTLFFGSVPVLNSCLFKVIYGSGNLPENLTGVSIESSLSIALKLLEKFFE